MFLFEEEKIKKFFKGDKLAKYLGIELVQFLCVGMLSQKWW